MTIILSKNSWHYYIVSKYWSPLRNKCTLLPDECNLFAYIAYFLGAILVLLIHGGWITVILMFGDYLFNRGNTVLLLQYDVVWGPVVLGIFYLFYEIIKSKIRFNIKIKLPDIMVKFRD